LEPARGMCGLFGLRLLAVRGDALGEPFTETFQVTWDPAGGKSELRFAEPSSLADLEKNRFARVFL
jgi:hypothetical protein